MVIVVSMCFFGVRAISRIYNYLKSRTWTNSKAFLTITCVIFQVSVAARMWGRAQVLVLLIVVLTTSTRGENAHQEDNQLKVGRSIDIFTRYGYLSLSMKVRIYIPFITRFLVQWNIKMCSHIHFSQYYYKLNRNKELKWSVVKIRRH